MKDNWQKFRSLFICAGILVSIAIALGVGFYKPKAQEIIKAKSIYQKYRTNDLVTNTIRDRSKDFVQIKINRVEDRDKIRKVGTIVEDYGAFVVVAKSKSKNISKSGLEIQSLKTEINLPSGKFEPISNPPEETVRPNTGNLESTSGKDYYVVQVAGLTKDEWLESFKEVGAEVIQYVPHQAFFVYGGGDAIQNIANHSRVRWVGKYVGEQKLSPQLNEFVSKIAREKTTFDIAVFSRANLLEVRDELAQTINGKVLVVEQLQHNFFNIIRVEMSPNDIENVANIKDVVRIDPYVKPVAEDERAAQIVAGNFINRTTLNSPGYNPLTQFGVDGTNVTVSISDDGISIPGNGGFYITANNTVNGPLRGASSGAGSGHGHINASIVAGNTPFATLDPTGYNYGRGVAPKANIINIPYLKSGNTLTDSQTVNDTVSTAGPNGVKGTIINNSWGDGTNGNSYDSQAAAWDGYVRDASFAGTIDPINVVFSAGNSGSLGLTRPKMAKNVIAVGNSENIRTEIGSNSADNIDDMRGSSSRGPAADGRIKPDITAPGSYITGSSAGNGTGVSGQIDANHSYSIGTSHSAPQIAGVAALFTQFWKNNNGGINPSPAMVKAAIINTGQEMTGFGSSNSLPNGDEGWGRVNMKFMLNTGVPMKYIDQTVEFTGSGNTYVTNGLVSDASKPVRISLVWSDPPAVSDPALVNNLDLKVTVGSNVYRGNVFTSGNSITGGSADTLNNVENVLLPAGIPFGTPITVEVIATGINGDGILGNGDSTDQHFALVAYNYSEQELGNKTIYDFDGDKRTDVSIFRPGSGEWWYLRSSDNVASAFQFGQGNDKIVPADFTGDGKTDIAFFRPSSSEWFVLRSEDNSFFSFPFGESNDIPVSADYDGDGKADPAIFRPSAATWYILKSGGGTTIQQFGQNGDVPMVQDFDGDGKTDIAIYRPSVSEFYYQKSSDEFNRVIGFRFGTTGDIAVPSDYTGDGKADIAFFRPSTGIWYILRSENNSFFAFPFGAAGDKPVPGDYDGDGKVDAAIFRPTNNTWYLLQSASGFQGIGFGTTNDIPLPSAFVR